MTSLAKVLEPSSCAAAARRAEDRDPRGPDGVGDARDQRRLGTDDHEVEALGEGGHGCRVQGVERQGLGDLGGARVARGADQRA